ncbi:MAG: hypothetical protein LKI03_00055 [Acetobacter indonesiensis]|jgi:hypothetical protein|nr:hypothetical protein [Acetobacter indonesiensis]MCI1545330.1 hypothetical protein [Acetobacter indonesiensis]MCI1764426.1 hypothetical protein [Acetobacter indonesiensis]
MADSKSTPSAAFNTAKVAAIVALIPSVFSALPQNVSLLVCAVMVTCAAITAAVPAPAHSRILIALYQIVRIGGLGVRYAVPYMATHLVKSAATPPADTSAPDASGAIATFTKDPTK